MTLTRRIKQFIDSHGYITLDKAHLMAEDMNHKHSTVERTLRGMAKLKEYETDYDDKNQVRGCKKSGYIVSDLKKRVLNADNYLKTLKADWKNGEALKEFYSLSKKANEELKKVNPKDYVLNMYLDSLRLYRDTIGAK